MVGKAEKQIDGALDHIIASRELLKNAQIALFEVRQAAVLLQGTAGPAGDLADTIIRIVDASMTQTLPEPEGVTPQ